MACYKKIGVIALIFLLVCIYLLVYSMPSFADYQISATSFANGYLANNGNVVYSPSWYCYYFENIDTDYDIIITFNYSGSGNDVRFLACNSFDDNGVYDLYHLGTFNVSSGTYSYSLSVPSSYKYVVFSCNSSNSVIITASNVSNGMSLSVGSLASSVASYDLWSTFGKAIPYILIVVLVAFGFYVIRRMCNKISKGKSGL